METPPEDLDPVGNEQTITNAEIRRQLYRDADELGSDAFAWGDEWESVKEEALDSMRRASRPYVERAAPESYDEVRHGDLFYWDSAQMGYSYWLIMNTHEGWHAYELLPSSLDPRRKPASEIFQKAQYVGEGKDWFVVQWHTELLP